MWRPALPARNSNAAYFSTIWICAQRSQRKYCVFGRALSRSKDFRSVSINSTSLPPHAGQVRGCSLSAIGEQRLYGFYGSVDGTSRRPIVQWWFDLRGHARVYEWARFLSDSDNCVWWALIAFSNRFDVLSQRTQLEGMRIAEAECQPCREDWQWHWAISHSRLCLPPQSSAVWPSWRSCGGGDRKRMVEPLLSRLRGRRGLWQDNVPHEPRKRQQAKDQVA